MNALEKKAIQHCIDTLSKIETHPIWLYVCNSIAVDFDPVLQKRLLDGLSDALKGCIKKPINEANEWLIELLKSEA